MTINRQDNSKFLQMPAELRREIYKNCTKGSLAALEASCKVAQADINPSDSTSKCLPWLECARRDFPVATTHAPGNISMLERFILDTPRSSKNVYKSVCAWHDIGGHMPLPLRMRMLHNSIDGGHLGLARDQLSAVFLGMAQDLRDSVVFFEGVPNSSI